MDGESGESTEEEVVTSGIGSHCPGESALAWISFFQLFSNMTSLAITDAGDIVYGPDTIPIA